MGEDEKKREKAGRLARQILQLAKDQVLVHLRFLDVAVSRLKPAEKWGLGGVATDGVFLYYDPLFLLNRYAEDPGYGARMYLHVLFHCIFYHHYQYGRLEPRLWDLAADLAVENTILELELPFAGLKGETERAQALQALREETGGLTAERLYRRFRQEPPSRERQEALSRLFFRDSHALWMTEKQRELAVSQEMWKKISERVKADLKSFSAGRNSSESLQKNLEEATKDRYDYGELLRRFMVMGESMQINEEEFDYIYYTYGLARYGNLPLIEPLEYREEKRVREFVIALDTSASCRGALVQAFLRKTYSILKSEERFFTKVNVHILQCDHEIRSDTRIRTQEEFDAFLREGKLTGFGTTDFRPVFAHVEGMLAGGEFENLKGLIYFTDGYGIYPETMPPYEVIFAFLEEDDRRPPVPPWAIRAVLEEEWLETPGEGSGQ